MNPQLARLFRLTRAIGTSGATAPPTGNRRHASRQALAVGALVFALLTVALEAMAETTKPEWRDPEYGQRLKQAKHWQIKRPSRPLVLVVGSSRTQYGVSPADMGFADEPGSPFVYNFGYRAATPLGTWFQLTRAMDAGLRPRAVLVQIDSSEIRSHTPAEVQLAPWASRLSAADIELLAPYTEDAAVFRRGLTAARRDPWAARHAALVSTLLPEWQPGSVRMAHRSWEFMDPHGYSPILPQDLTENFQRQARELREAFREVINGPQVGAVSERAHRAIVARCRANNIPVAMCWAPEGPSYRAMYTPAGRAVGADYERRLTADLGVAIFPAPEHLTDDDFADGYHLMPHGAEKYSRWLADEHLRWWLAEVLK